MVVHQYMKIGEAYYKLDQCDKALDYFKQAEKSIEPREDYLIYFF
jgi:tetratricopeptide (TPR) repeat protein